MSHGLTDAELARYREAFEGWGSYNAGTIDAGDMCLLLRVLGGTPSDAVELMCRIFHDAEPERITFDVFLNIIAGNPCYIPAIDEDEALLQSIAKNDDGSGFVDFRQLMRTLHKHLDDIGHNLSYDDFVNIYDGILDVALFQNASGNLDNEVLWTTFQDEFDDLWRETSAMTAVYRAPVGATCEPPGRHQLDHPVQVVGQPASFRLTVVDLSGNQLLSGTFNSDQLVLELQQQVEETVGVSIHQQVLLAEEGPVGQQSSLSDVGVADGSTLLLVRKSDLRVDYATFLQKFAQAYLEMML